MPLKGEKATLETREKARKSNPYSVIVQTPRGLFRSIHEAAAAHGVPTGTVVYYLNCGEKQRKTGKLSTHGNDFREWKRITPGVKPKPKPCITPLGEFPSVLAASKAHKTTANVILKRLNTGMKGYIYKE